MFQVQEILFYELAYEVGFHNTDKEGSANH